MRGYDESRKCCCDTTCGDEDAAVSFLAELAGGGRALEPGIGAGRIALPLAAHGIRVVDVDISRRTVAQMRLAGLRLRDRWSDWDYHTFDTKSEMHISVYGAELEKARDRPTNRRRILAARGRAARS